MHEICLIQSCEVLMQTLNHLYIFRKVIFIKNKKKSHIYKPDYFLEKISVYFLFDCLVLSHISRAKLSVFLLL